MGRGNPHATVATDHNIFRSISIDQAVNIQFADLTYKVTGDTVQSSTTLVNGVSGEFRAGELSAIIGPSGCGKTTLLNLLSGYRIQRTSGDVSVNGKPLDRRVFHKMSRYVLQDDDISPHFTVMESMMFASNLKLDSRYTTEQRRTVIFDILNILHLDKEANTLISNISGGQRKRVCIALELIDNPSVLFLDEPTTGLDEFSASQCLKLLKKLANCGRTIICSLHCPSIRLFQMFNKVYAMAKGQCIYQGAVDHIVPYLERFDLNCPVSYNPTDFIIEVSVHVYGNFHDEMVHEIHNGKITKWLPDSQLKQTLSPKTVEKAVEGRDCNLKLSECNRNSWWSEYRLIFGHFMGRMWRDKTNLKLRISVHILLSLLLSFAYVNVGGNAKFSIYNYHYTMLVVIKFFFLAMVPMLANVPLEMKYIRRQYFNRWYRLSSYFVALITSQLPILCTMSFICSALLYFIPGHPVELFRFALFVGMVLLISLMSSSFGLLLGSRFSVVNALFLGPYIMALLTIVASNSTEKTELSTFEQIIMYSSFIRYPLEGLLATLLYFNRSDFICPPSEIFCLTSKPKYVLKLAGSLNISYIRSAVVMILICLLFAVMSFVILKSRLSTRTSENSMKSHFYHRVKIMFKKLFPN